MCLFLPSPDKSAWGAIHCFFHFFFSILSHPDQRTKLSFWSQLLSLQWHLYFNLIFSATQQRLNHSAGRLEKGWTERGSLEDGGVLSVVRWTLRRDWILIFFWTASYLRPLLSQNAHPSQKSRVDRWFYKPVMCLLVELSSFSTLRATGETVYNVTKRTFLAPAWFLGVALCRDVTHSQEELDGSASAYLGSMQIQPTRSMSTDQTEENQLHLYFIYPHIFLLITL